MPVRERPPYHLMGTSKSDTVIRCAIAIALAIATLAGVARAQVPVPPPGPPPLTRPSVPTLPGAPSQLTSVPGAVATPLLTPAPVLTASPTPAARLFNCSCFATTSGTEWAGTVAASSYTAASSAATSACINYITSTPQSPYIPPGQSPGLSGTNNQSSGTQSSGTQSSGTTPGSTSGTSSSIGLPPGVGTSSNSPYGALKNEPSLTGQRICNVCACN
jgi:hypothetical protein